MTEVPEFSTESSKTTCITYPHMYEHNMCSDPVSLLITKIDYSSQAVILFIDPSKIIYLELFEQIAHIYTSEDTPGIEPLTPYSEMTPTVGGD